MKGDIRILYLEDSVRDLGLVEDSLKMAGLGFKTTQAATAEAFDSALGDGRFDLILCDANLPEYDGFAAVELARQRCPDTPVLMISGSISEEEIVKSLHMGATDYILKQRLERLGPSVKRALAEAEAVQKARAMEAENKKLEAQFLRVQRLENIGALAGGIAHDLNNALVPVMMGVELLKGDMPQANRLRLLETMKASAQRGAEMVKQITSFARGVSGKPAVLNVKHLVAEIAKLCKDTFPPSIQIETKSAEDLHLVEGNATQLHQVLLNLCVNARDAMPEGGTLRIETANLGLDKAIAPGRSEAVSGPHVVLSVSDTGHGMSPEVLSRIFEPFYTTKEPGKGTGLGLSTVQGIVTAHNGFMEVSSRPGTGTVFKVYLPATREVETERGGDGSPNLPAGHGELVLVVDDDLAILEMVRETLDTFGYRVLTASNGLEALPPYQKHAGEIAVVITDMMMPVLDGPATIQMLRQINPKVKIIGVSGLGSEAAAVTAGKKSVNAFLKKPYSTGKLLETLREVVGQNV